MTRLTPDMLDLYDSSRPPTGGELIAAICLLAVVLLVYGLIWTKVLT
jgi:hypothetical protein